MEGDERLSKNAKKAIGNPDNDNYVRIPPEVQKEYDK